MALVLGTENKRHVYIVIGLFALMVVLAGWEFQSSQGGSPTEPNARDAVIVRNGANLTVDRTRTRSTSDGRNGTEARKLGGRDLNLALRLDRLARSEQVEYSGSGRNIFSMEAPVQIEAPIASARPIVTTPAPAPVPAPPKPPTIDLKYLGYAQSKDNSFGAVFVRGDDMFLAKSGEIMYHRYKVGAIQPTSVQVTDLRYNNTQTILLTTN
jgi:hypothetical protein